MSKSRLIIVGGFAGAGKTTLAKALSVAYDWPRVSTDELNTTVRETTGLDFHQASPAAHETAWRLVHDHLANNVTVILDTPMCNDRSWQNVDSVREQMPHVDVVPLILECPLETHKARINERGQNDPDHLNLGGDAFEDIVFKYEYIKNLQRVDFIRINAEGLLEEVYSTVIKHLDIASSKCLPRVDIKS